MAVAARRCFPVLSFSLQEGADSLAPPLGPISAVIPPHSKYHRPWKCSDNTSYVTLHRSLAKAHFKRRMDTEVHNGT